MADQLPSHWKRRCAGLSAVVVVLLLLFWFLFRPDRTPLPAEQTGSGVADKYVIRKGQTFSSFDDYLRLFGITVRDTQWYQPVPHHEGVILWGPQFHHPEWHNDGNPDSLMPTITEYWEPATGSQSPEVRALLAKMNNEGYYIALRSNEVRITFMRGLKDSTFIFLGVYRMSLDKSDTTRIVWERIADECDLRALEYLELLRR